MRRLTISGEDRIGQLPQEASIHAASPSVDAMGYVTHGQDIFAAVETAYEECVSRLLAIQRCEGIRRRSLGTGYGSCVPQQSDRGRPVDRA